MDPRRCATHCNKGILRVPLILLSVLILVGLLINSRFFTRKDDGLVNEPARAPEAPIPILERPVTPSSLEDDVEYIRSYLSKEGLVKRVDNPTNWLNITCDNSTENFALYYLYARGQDQNHYNAPLTCEETFRRSICPGNQYLEDLRLRSILSNVSEYLTYNVLTENDLRMASLALEFKYQPRIDYQPNYKDPRIAYLLMSAHSPWFLQYSIDQIRKNARNETIMYTTFDYNSNVLERFNETITANPDLKVLPTRWLGNWGGISLVYLEVNAWLELLKVDGWDYIINLSDSDGFVIPANIVEQNVKDLSGQSIIECPYGFVYSQGYNDSCIHANAAYRYTNVWIDCGSKIRGTNSHPMLKPIFPKYTIPSIKASQWKVFSRSVIEKLVTSQDFWDILFSYRYSLVPDEHVIINAVKRILPKEKFIYHNVHYKNWTAKPVDEKMITEAMGAKAWFIRKIDKKEQFETLARLREERYGRL